MRLRPFTAADVPALIALQHAGAGAGTRWSEAAAAAQLLDPDHAHGAHVIVAEDGGAVVGGAGWVAGDGGEFFGSPLLARDGAVAAALIDDVLARARAAGARWVRIGSTGEGDPRRDALIARGFAPRFEFVTLACPAAPRAAPGPAGLARIAIADADPRALQALHDETFAGVDNSLPISLEEVHLVQAHAWPDGSGVWLDGARAAAFLHLVREASPVDHVVIEAIGVGRAWQRRGIARALVDGAIAAAAAAGAAEVRAMIASTNAASLALHRAAGLREAFRRDIWQRTF